MSALTEYVPCPRCTRPARRFVYPDRVFCSACLTLSVPRSHGELFGVWVLVPFDDYPGAPGQYETKLRWRAPEDECPT